MPRPGPALTGRSPDIRRRPAQRFAFDPREIDALLATRVPRRELAYRLAIHGLCDRCRGDDAFRRRTDELLARVREADLAALMAEADRLARELTERTTEVRS